MTGALEWSERLHARVREFALGSERDGFEELAWELASFQRAHVPSLRRLWQGVAPSPGKGLAAIPALSVEAMRFVPVYAFPPEGAAHVFHTSGTTGSETGRHYGRVGTTYQTLLLETAKQLLFPGSKRAVVIALLPHPGAPPRSSLGFMAARFMEFLDGRSLSEERDVARFDLREPGRWLWSVAGLDVEGLGRAVELARQVNEPVLLLTTSFALLSLLEQLDRRGLPLPPGSIVMPTGGFKGRTREVDPGWLRALTAERLCPHAIVSEYGMTELSSQLYERTHPGLAERAEPGLYFEPRTLRVLPIDPITLAPVPDGTVGLASFVDLGNVDSAVRIATRDLVVREGAGIRLLGRSPLAPLRGCSLVAEALPRPRPAPATPASRGASAPDPGAVERVRKLVEAARRLADPRTEAGRRLRQRLSAGPLSSQGVELALELCLETAPTEAELAALVASVPRAQRAWIVASANVFVGAHRAIALGLAASRDVRVRPSRREPSMTEALHELTGDLFQLVSAVEPAASDAVFAYGSDATLETIRAALPDGVDFHPHGDGIGAVWVASDAHASACTSGLALDVSLFDQRGCASPRIVALGEGVTLEPFVEALAAELRAMATRLPLGRLSDDERAAVAHFRSLAVAVAERVVEVGESVLAVQQDPDQVLMPPIGRHLVLLTGPRALDRLVASSSVVTTLAVAGTAEDSKRGSLLFPQARVCEPGFMQRPRFDGPLDLRQLRTSA